MFRMFLGIVLALIVVYSLGHIADHWMDFTVSMDGELLSPLIGAIVVGVIAIVSVVVGFVITMSVIGALALVFGAVLVGVFFAGMSVFWPVIVILLVVYLINKSKEKSVSY